MLMNATLERTAVYLPELNVTTTMDIMSVSVLLDMLVMDTMMERVVLSAPLANTLHLAVAVAVTVAQIITTLMPVHPVALNVYQAVIPQVVLPILGPHARLVLPAIAAAGAPVL